MNNSVIIFIIIIQSLTFSSLKGQKYHYMNELIQLSIDSSSFIGIFKADSAFKNSSTLFEQDSSVLYYITKEEMPDSQYLLLRVNYKIDDISSFLESYNLSIDDFSDYSYGYKREDAFIWPNSLINFKLAAKCNLNELDSLLSAFDASVVINNELFYTFHINSMTNVFSLVEILNNNSCVEWVEPDFYTNITTFNDTYYQYQYYLKNTGQNNGMPGIDLNAEKAWSITKGNPSIKIAVIDTGVEDHEDLKFDNGNSKVLCGFSVFYSNCGKPGGNHGQAVAGIIGASHNNIGIKGVAPNCYILPVRIGKNDKSFYSNSVIAHSLYLAAFVYGADVMSCSWGTGAPSNVIAEAVNMASLNGRNGKGCVIVFASGNSNRSSVSFPASLSSVLAVGAISKYGSRSNYSNYGNELDVCCVSNKGDVDDIWTIDREGNCGFLGLSSCGYSPGAYYSNFGGTSAACPQAAGVAALLLSRNPNLTSEQVLCRLKYSCIDLGAFGWDPELGFGLLNAYYSIAYDYLLLENVNYNGMQIFSVSNQIIAGNNCIIGSNANVKFNSGNEINLEDGFITLEGATFEAVINDYGPCGNNPPFRIVNNIMLNHKDYETDFIVNEYNNNYYYAYPNPNNGQFYLESYINDHTLITIYDILSKIIYKQNVHFGLNIIDLSKYPKGIYILSFRTASGNKLSKIILY